MNEFDPCARINAKPLTAEERVKEIHSYICGCHFEDECLKFILEHIQQACESARAEAHEQWHHPNAAYAQGFADAREKAAKVVESPIREDHSFCYPCDCCGEIPQEYYPPKIRAVKGPNE